MDVNSSDLKHQNTLGSEGLIKLQNLLNPCNQNTKNMKGKPLDLDLRRCQRTRSKKGTYKDPKGDPKGKEEFLT